ALVVEDSTITGNIVADGGELTPLKGGGIRSSGASATIARSTVVGNEVQSAFGGGGGIARTGSPAVVAWSTVSDNRAGLQYASDDFVYYTRGAGGGGINGPVDLLASTVSGNWSGGDGGGLAGEPI